MTRRRHLVAALADPGFRHLFGVRLAAQFGDGVFQASLAGAVLFDPQRQANATDVAAAFAVLLLPYSLLGPFAGVFLDRWWRRRLLVVANVVRAVAVLAIAAEISAGVSGVPFYASALVVISIGRFVLSALSAAQPHVVADAELVTANAAVATTGTVATALGGAVAIGVRAVIGDGDADYAVIAAAAMIPFLVSARIAGRFALSALGPSDAERSGRETPAEVVRGLVAGARYVLSIPPVARGLTAIGVHRLCYGIWTVCTLLLYRNYFTDSGIFRAGLAGLGQVVAAVACGGALAAFVTPAAFRRAGAVVWPGTLLGASAVLEPTLGLAYSLPMLVLAALLLSFCAQGFKISVDTLVQHHAADAYRGRIFALYDMLFNVALVLAAAITAAALPEDGRSPVAVVAVALGWAATAIVYVRSSVRTTV